MAKAARCCNLPLTASIWTEPFGKNGKECLNMKQASSMSNGSMESEIVSKEKPSVGSESRLPFN